MASRMLGTRIWRPLLLPLVAVLIGATASLASFATERGAVNHTDQALLRQYAVQGSLILSSFVGQTPQDVIQLTKSLDATSPVPPDWQGTAAGIAQHDRDSAVAIVKAVAGRFRPVAVFGSIHGQLGTSADASMITPSVRAGASYSAITRDSGKRWLTQLVGSTSAPGLFVYSESPITETLVNLASLPGHPFSGIEGAVYVGRETPDNLLLSTTRRLPLSGERAVAAISTTPVDSNTAPRLSDRVGSVSDAGGFILVIRSTQELAGAPSAVLPWILLTLGLVLTSAVAGLLWISESRRAKLAALVGSLEATNTALDRAVSLQESTAERFSAMVRSSSDLTTVMDTDGRITYQSPSSLSLLGRPPESLLNKRFSDLVHPVDLALWQGALDQAGIRRSIDITQALRLSTSSGSYVSVETRITNLVDDPAVVGVVLNSRDITEQQRLEDELRHQAFHDSLTGLANRALFEDRLDNALGRLGRATGEISVLFLDLDDFKAVNDGRGHDVGDALLQAVGERLKTVVRSGDTLARIGGDEFAVLLESANKSAATDTAARIKVSLDQPLTFGSSQATVRVSIGIATASQPGTSAQELLRNADVAMYAAKNAGKDRIETFHTGLHDEVIRRLELELDLGRAIENSELAVHYQALVDLESNEMVGVEALMRWDHPTRGMVMPAEFIPVAESTGLIVGMGKWMLRQACQDIRELQAATGRSALRLSVNLSTKQLDHPDIVGHVQSALSDSGLPPSLLTLELTESVFMDSSGRSHAALRQLKAIGVRLSIDDFGTGFSSLGYLNRLPVDELKIDRTFIAAASSQARDTRSLIHTIIRLAQDFGLGTVAEGIETRDQLEMIRRAGCQVAQGYLFARPTDLGGLMSKAARPAADRSGSRRATLQAS